MSNKLCRLDYEQQEAAVSLSLHQQIYESFSFEFVERQFDDVFDRTMRRFEKKLFSKFRNRSLNLGEKPVFKNLYLKITTIDII